MANNIAMKSTFSKVQLILIVSGMMITLFAQAKGTITMDSKLLTSLIIFGLVRVLQIMSADRGADFIEDRS